MRTTAIAALSLLVLTGCGNGTGQAEAEEPTDTSSSTAPSPQSTTRATPSPAPSSTPKSEHTLCVEQAVSSYPSGMVPVLEADQTHDELGADIVDALNSWFEAGGQIIDECWSKEGGDAALRETVAAIAQAYKKPYAEALLVENFDSQWRDNPGQLHIEDLAVIHQNQLYRAQGNTWSIAGSIAEAYDITYEQTAPATFHASPTGLLIPIQMTHDPLPSFMREQPAGTINAIPQYEDNRVRIADLQIG